MSEKAEATAKRIQQSMSDLERQISWVTRASAPTTDCEQRRADYAQLLNQVPPVSQLSLLSAPGPRTAAPVRARPSRSAATPISPATSASPRPSRAAPALRRPISADQRPFMSIALSHADGSVTVAEIDLGFLVGFPDDAQVGKVGVCLCHRSQGRGAGELRQAGPRSARICRRCRRSQPSCKPGGVAPTSGKDARRQRGADDIEPGAEARLARVLRTADRAGADADPRSAGADRASDRARPRGRDHRRHHHGAAHAGADHGAAGRRAASRRRRFRPPHRGEDRRTSWKSWPTSSTAWPGSWPRPIPASKTR